MSLSEDSLRTWVRSSAYSPDLRSHVMPGDTVAWGQFGAQPLRLTRALMAQRHDIGEFRVFLGIGVADHPAPVHADVIQLLSYGGGGTNRALTKQGVLDIWPCHYSQLPDALRSGVLKIDVLMLQVSPPDEQGWHSLGLAHEYLLCALETARTVIGEINPQVPWTFGERYLRREDFTLLVDSEDPLPDVNEVAVDRIEQAIGQHVAGMIENGSTLQTGIGSLPDALLSALLGHSDLGVHSGAIGDGVAML